MGLLLTVQTRLARSLFVLPVPTVEWVLPFDQGRWRLVAGGLRIGPGRTAGLGLAYSPVQQLTLHDWASSWWGSVVSSASPADSPIQDGVGRDSALPLIAGIDWRADAAPSLLPLGWGQRPAVPRRARPRGEHRAGNETSIPRPSSAERSPSDCERRLVSPRRRTGRLAPGRFPMLTRGHGLWEAGDAVPSKAPERACAERDPGRRHSALPRLRTVRRPRRRAGRAAAGSRRAPHRRLPRPTRRRRQRRSPRTPPRPAPSGPPAARCPTTAVRLPRRPRRARC